MDVARVLKEEGVLLEAARGVVSNVAELVAGEPLHGSWWSHPAANKIFATTRALRESPDVLVCRLIDGKVTFVHRRLWPALVRLADRLGHDHLAQLYEEHGSGGRHLVHEIAYPHWVPPEVRKEGAALSERDAAARLPEAVRRAM